MRGLGFAGSHECFVGSVHLAAEGSVQGLDELGARIAEVSAGVISAGWRRVGGSRHLGLGKGLSFPCFQTVDEGVKGADADDTEEAGEAWKCVH